MNQPKRFWLFKCFYEGRKPCNSSSHMWWQTFHPFCPSPGPPLIPSWSPSWKVQKGPQQRLLNLMDSFRLSSWPHCWWWLLLRAVMASLMDPICLPLIRNASQSPQPPHNTTTTTQNNARFISDCNDIVPEQMFLEAKLPFPHYMLYICCGAFFKLNFFLCWLLTTL